MKAQTRILKIGNLPKEQGQRINRECGRWGHQWEYSKDGTRRCTRIFCQRTTDYTPNKNGRREF